MTNKDKREENSMDQTIDVSHKTDFMYTAPECNWRLMEFPKSKFMYSLAHTSSHVLLRYADSAIFSKIATLANAR